ncbi:MAG: polysaccharide deacetylase family protein [Oscillospiraceae bacterium]
MKIGSVKFFKVVILSAIALMIIIPLVLSIVFGVRSVTLSRGINELAQEQNRMQAMLTTQESLLRLTSGERLSQPIADNIQDTYANSSSAPSFEYQTLYANLYSEIPSIKKTDDRVAYLTFDDGPSANTLRVLEILDKYKIKATFFVTGPSSEAHPDYLKAIIDAGHTIGVHSYSHKYDAIYASVDAYLADFEKMHTFIYKTTGVFPEIFRFPGGSVNSYNSYLYEEIISEMTRRGFPYYDWNVSSGDVSLGITRQDIIANVLKGSEKQNRSIILMHDRLDTENTVSALPDIIEGLQAQGYTFAPITSDVRPVTFNYRK